MAEFDSQEFATSYQHSQNSGENRPDLKSRKSERMIGKEAARMSVWFWEYSESLRTNFPPPEGFKGREDGKFGVGDYQRSLDKDEVEFYRTQQEGEVSSLRVAGEAARRVWFGMQPEAETPDSCRSEEANGMSETLSQDPAEVPAQPRQMSEARIAIEALAMSEARAIDHSYFEDDFVDECDFDPDDYDAMIENEIFNRVNSASLDIAISP